MPDLFPFQQNPTQEEPMLIGFMIDISLSMIKTIRTSSAISQRRLDDFGDAIDNFVSRSCVESLTTIVALSTTSTLQRVSFCSKEH